ncbi:MAG: hypothetical protein IH611_07975 [Deltaproteobacteria bacterium]|nr:hypothetical protein [Deltaproteobacteria bacterium]
MRIFVYSLLGIPLLFVDAVLLYTLPNHLAGRFSAVQAGILAAGASIYLIFHFLVRKPERLYVWGHELTHLVVAKLFLRQVHGFHITSRTGGKVVIDRTNVAIDLAPYAVPLYSLAAIGPAIFFRGEYVYAREIYLAAAAFLFSMHLVFSVEGFLQGQPDLRRSGRIFSGGVVVLFLLLMLPILWAPATRAGFQGIHDFYADWLGSGFSSMRRLVRLGSDSFF